jgi:hypothetical protein
MDEDIQPQDAIDVSDIVVADSFTPAHCSDEVESLTSPQHEDLLDPINFGSLVALVWWLPFRDGFAMAIPRVVIA